MKILYVIRSTAHFSYHESTIRKLCERGHLVHALFDEKWSDGRSVEVVDKLLTETSQFTVGDSLHRADRWRNWLFPLRELLSYASYLNRPDQSDFYLKRWHSYLNPFFRNRVTRSKWGQTLVASPVTQFLIRSLEKITPPAQNIKQSLAEFAPDVVVVSPVNMRFSEDVEYVKAAQALKIPTILPVLSWDNLTTKGLIHVIPDWVLAWNQAHYDEAKAVHGVPEDQLIITGSQFFDKWFGADLQLSREAFCQRVGLPPENPFCLYLGSSGNIAKDETWLVQEFIQALRNHPTLKNMSVLIRPHPANAKIYLELDLGAGVNVFPKEGSLPDTEEAKIDFYNAIYHCVAALGINTTGMIDAIINDKPCITIMTAQYEATQRNAIHFVQLLEADVLEVTNSISDAVETIHRLMNGGDAKQNLRRKFVEAYVRPRGLSRPAGDVNAQVIELAALGKTKTQIESELAHNAK